MKSNLFLASSGVPQGSHRPSILFSVVFLSPQFAGQIKKKNFSQDINKHF